MAEPAVRRRRRWPRRLLVAGLFFLALLFFAPWIAAKTGLVQILVGNALTDFDGRVTVGSASLGWLLPVEFTDITVTDTQGRTMLTVPRVATSNSLLSLTLDRGNLGTVTLEHPTAEIVCEKNTTNIETSLAKLLAVPPTGKPAPTLTVAIAGGTLKIRDADAAKEWTFDSIEATAALAASETAIKVKAASAGRTLDAEVKLGTVITANIASDGFPLEPAGPFLRRFEPGVSLAGAFTASLATESRGESHRIHGELAIADFSLASPRLGKETLAMKAVKLPLAIEVAGALVKVEKADLTCDLGAATVQGTINTAEPVDKMLDSALVAATADVDLARMFALFPNLLQLQPGTTIREGRVTASLAHSDLPGGRRWSGKLESKTLVIAHQTKAVTWENPIRAEFRGTLDARLRPAFDSLSVQSDFLNAKGEGKLEAFTLAADVSLDRLAERLGQFIDLRGTSLAGSARLDAQSKLEGQGSVFSGRTMLNGLRVVHRDFRFAGKGDLSAKVRFDDKRIDVDGLAGSLEGVRFRGLGMDVDEPLVRVLPTDVAIDRTTGAWSIPKLQAATQTVSVGAEKIAITTEGASFQAGVNINLGQLQRTLMLPGEPINGIVNGGRIEASILSGKQHLSMRLPVSNFSYGPTAKPIWSEPNLTLTLTGMFDKTKDTLAVESATIERPDGVAVAASGSINEVTTKQLLDLAGQISYDLAALEPQLKQALGPSVKAAGKERRPFHLRGTAEDPTLLVGDASFGWQSLSAYGFDLAANKLDATLDRGVLTTSPLEAKFTAGGTVKLKPTIRLQAKTYDLTFDHGRVLDNTTLTTAACADALGFAIPAIAKSTKAEGTFSFDLGDHRIPLDDPRASTLKGTMTLHNVTVIAGPVIGEIATLFGQAQPKLTLAQNQTVAIRVEKGRVHHDKLTFTMAGYSLTTTGSVGFDGSLALKIEAPLPESAVGPLLKNLPKIKDAVVNKRMTIPIGGTLAKPTVDRDAFRAAVQQFVREVSKDAAAGKLDELLKGLGPKKP